MNKKHIIIAAGLGLLSFAGAFITVMMLGRPGQPAPAAATPIQSGQQMPPATPEASAKDDETDDEEPVATVESRRQAGRVNDKQLKALIYDVREKIREYENKQKELELREARLAVTQETLKKDIDELTRMRIELAALVANLKEQRNKLLETRAEIAQSEKANLASIAATYDKMDSASASKILSSMCAKQMESGRPQGGAIDDAVKILYYMTERTKAKLLAEMAAAEPKLSAMLCQRLKEIVEQK